MGTNESMFFFSSIGFFLVLVNGFWMDEMEKRMVTFMQLLSPWMDLVCIVCTQTKIIFTRIRACEHQQGN